MPLVVTLQPDAVLLMSRTAMRPLLPHVSQSIFRDALSTALRIRGTSTKRLALNQANDPWDCSRCRFQTRELSGSRARPWNEEIWNFHRVKLLRSYRDSKVLSSGSRNFSSTTSKRQDTEKHGQASSRSDLPSQEEGRRSHVAKRFSHLMDNVQSNIFIAGQRLNDLTGYSGIEALKKEIEEQEELVRTTRDSVQKAKADYTTAIATRSASQREVNELLQRKNSWSPQDLERFTSLYRSDHANEVAETSAQEAVTLAEGKAEEASSRLSATILARYHEEQIWSDKIRRMSTWGTWGLMGVNVLLFMVFQVAVEPWRRKRLVKGFEEKVMEALEREGAATNAATGAALAALQASHVASTQGVRTDASVEMLVAAPEVVDIVEEPAPADSDLPVDAVPESVPLEPEWGWSSVAATMDRSREAIHDLFSERQITLRKVDLTTAAIEGTFAGVAIASIIAAVLRSMR
ncbi:sensitivity to high expression protein she9 [Lambiella insularis]|nr:sensitivity to high expression protein she9 [Lambiella insularis]